MSQAILTALKALDVSNDNHWTADGLPRLDTVKMLASDQTLTRDSVSAAAPGFIRSNALSYEAQTSSPEGAGDTSTATGSPQGEAPPAQPEEAADQGNSAGAQDSGAAAAPQPAANGDSDDSGEAGETQPPEVDGGSGSAAAEVTSLEAELEAATEEVNRLRVISEAAVKKYDLAQKRRDALVIRAEEAKVGDTNAEAIQQYLAAQRARLEERGARQQLILESGLNLKELARNLKAPIDAAMARKNSRGTQRPKG